MVTRTGTPQSCWWTWQAGYSFDGSSSQDAAIAETCRTPSVAASDRTRARWRSVPAAGAVRQEFGRGRGDEQAGRRAVAGVEFLAGRGREDDVQPERPRGDFGGRALGAVGDGLDPYGLVGQPQPGQPVACGLHHDDVLADQHGGGGLAQVRGERRHLTRRRIEAAQGVVVRVRDRDGAVR